MIDRVEVHVQAGDGGNGVVSFRREKYVPFGGPDGGNGGRGGSVHLMADAQLSTLYSMSRRKHLKAGTGGNGLGKKMQGKQGEDLLVKVPMGTLVYRRSNGDTVLIADLVADGQQEVVARGGRGGVGNTHFATSTNQAPRIAQKGEPGEEAWLILELKLVADVGIIGYPSVGKSTLLAAASAARPKIAEYPFTTQEPVLGVVVVGNHSFVLAEIPGLIEGAHRGAGLGHYFLRHAERTRLLIHLLDGTSDSPLADMESVNRELALFNPTLGLRPQIAAVNKIDLPEVEARIPELREQLGKVKRPLHFVSAATTAGVRQLMARAAGMLEDLDQRAPEAAPAVFRPQPRDKTVLVSREGNVFVVSLPEAESLIARMDLTSAEARSYLKRQLVRMGVGAALKKAGAGSGDRVRVGEMELDWE